MTTKLNPDGPKLETPEGYPDTGPEESLSESSYMDDTEKTNKNLRKIARGIKKKGNGNAVTSQ